jgi:alkanesulfonate monooxygenase SsuD/methylene tetrahydromethanopterin reductase-like flavin-dependent oxidoreductase (luciferase family)
MGIGVGDLSIEARVTKEESMFRGKFYEITEPQCWSKPVQKPHPHNWTWSISRALACPEIGVKWS